MQMVAARSRQEGKRGCLAIAINGKPGARFIDAVTFRQGIRATVVADPPKTAFAAFGGPAADIRFGSMCLKRPMALKPTAARYLRSWEASDLMAGHQPPNRIPARSFSPSWNSKSGIAAHQNMPLGECRQTSTPTGPLGD